MDDLLGPPPRKLFDALREETEHRATLHLLLMEKGIISSEEYEAAHVRVVAEFDQQLAARREEYLGSEEGKAAAFLSRILTGGKRE